MRFRDIQRFTEIPYDEKRFDCADLVIKVQRELFARDVVLAGKRPRGVAGQVVLGELSKAHAQRTQSPVDGDLILTRDFGQVQPGHAGVYFRLAHEDWILHTTPKIGCSVCHRLRDLPDYGLQVEGFYAWI